MDSFDEVRKPFEAYIGDIVYATMTTVDRRGRPRARVLIPVWEVVDDRPLGWLATYRTPVKAAHLAGNPHATFSYWTPRQNFVAPDTVAHWVDDEATRRHVWELYRITSPSGAGYDLGRSWRDPDDPTLHVLGLEPHRIQVVDGRDLHGTVWRPTTSAGINHSPGGRPS